MKVSSVVERLCKSKQLLRLLQFVGLPRSVQIEEVCVVTGSPRSGTTWLAEMLSEKRGAKMLDEPLHLSRYPRLKKRGIAGWRTALPANKENEELERHLRRAFTGQLHGFYEFTTSNPVGQLYEYVSNRRLVVKMVRAGRLLPWLEPRFPNLGGVVHIIRHPCAVVSSQLKYKGGKVWGSRKKSDIDTSVLNIICKNRYKNINKIISNIDTTAEALAAQWCLDNYFLVVNDEYDVKGKVVNYEDIVLDPKKGVEKVIKHINMKGKKIEEKKYVERSHSAEEKIESKSKQINKWKKHLSERQVKEIREVVKQFGAKKFVE